MSRNEEKSQSMLSRYLQAKKEGGPGKRRPYLARLCDDVDEAEKWRRQVLGDIRRRVSEIQNEGLDDVRARELNDSINKLLRERRHWERQVVFLGGRDHSKKRRREAEEAGDDVFQHNGYFYFGAARRLPGVMELIERQRRLKEDGTERKGESKETLEKRVGKDYFGYMDDEDGSLDKIEKEAEEKQILVFSRAWENENEGRKDAEWDSSYLAFVGKKPEMNCEEEVQRLVLERRKMEMLEELQADDMKRN